MWSKRYLPLHLQPRAHSQRNTSWHGLHLFWNDMTNPLATGQIIFMCRVQKSEMSSCVSLLLLLWLYHYTQYFENTCFSRRKHEIMQKGTLTKNTQKKDLLVFWTGPTSATPLTRGDALRHDVNVRDTGWRWHFRIAMFLLAFRVK